MVTWFPLAIFPEGALASSVITTVLVGVWVTVFFNLRFGWVLSGLVVPGYLAPLILLEPVSAGVVALEAVITYAIVRLLSVYLAGAIGWTTFFGRDRFFALIIVSIAVRLVMDGVVLPPIAVWLNANYDLGFDWTRDLESFGLIVIALYANQFWKTGLARGIFTSGVIILLTLVIVRFGLMEMTNFRISDIGYLYELLAASLVASSKAYIILVLTAFLASRLNLRAGLDFNGLLIPALVALQWYEPMKIVTSIGEALIILALGSLLLRSPLYANRTMEGGRKLLLFFNVSFAWKMAVGYAVLWSGYEMKTADAYGFGYLLSTLVALKLHDKGGAVRMLTALTAVSAQGAVAGTVVGFGLSEGARALAPITAEPEEIRPAPREVDSDLIAMSVQRRAYAASTAPPPDPDTLIGFREGLRTLLAEVAPDASNLEDLADARRKIALAGLGVRVTDDNRLVLENVVSQTGRTAYLIDPAATTDLTVSLPDAQGARGLSSAAAALFELTGARALIVQGREEAALSTGPGSLFHAAHEALGGSVVQLATGQGAQSVMEVAGRYPQGFDLAALETRVGDVELVSGARARQTPQRAAARTGFALLDLKPAALHALTAAVDGGEISVAEGPGGLPERLRAAVASNAEAPSARPPTVADLLYAETEILAPLIDNVLPALRAGTSLDEATENALLSLDVSARSIGYRLRVLRDSDGGARHVLLTSDAVSWGSFAFRIGRGRPVFVHVPSGLRDRRTLNFGLSLFRRLDATAMLVSGRIDRDGLPAPDLNVLNPDHPPGLYDLVAKLLIQSRAGESVSLVLRNVGEDTAGTLPGAEMVMSPESLFGSTIPGAVAAETLANLSEFGVDFVLHEGSAAYAGFEPGVLPQAGFLSARPRASFLSLWLAPDLLDLYADRLGETTEAALFRTLGVPDRTGALTDLAGGCVRPGPFSEEVRNALRRYQQSRSPVALQRLAGAEGLAVERIGDIATQQTFLAIREAQSRCLRAVANLNPVSAFRVRRAGGGPLDAETLVSFAEARDALLILPEADP